MSAPVSAADLSVTPYLDHDHPQVQAFARDAAAGAVEAPQVVANLFARVRDDIRYDPYHLSADPADYRASAVLAAGSAYCVPKAVLMAAAARALGVPARLGFADVRNHLQSDRLRTVMGTDLFAYHGYAVVCVDGAWHKASPAFNRELCERFGVPPLEFDGTADALMHAFDGEGRTYMEYVVDHGEYDELPFGEIMGAYRDLYPAMDLGGGSASSNAPG